MQQTSVTSDQFEYSQPEWFVSWFRNPAYLKLYQHRSQDEAKQTVQMIVNAAGLRPTADEKSEPLSVLDIACGAGRHAIELAKQGFSVTANDLSPFLLKEMDALAKAQRVNVSLSQCDMREIGFKEAFDLVVQLFSSFGYFQDQEDEERVITNVYRALKPGGWYVLDFFNSNYVRKNLNPFSAREIDGINVLEERRIQNDRVEKMIALNENGQISRFKESVRLYSYEELELMVAEAGFEICKVLGNYNAEQFCPLTSPRVIIVARKQTVRRY